MKICIIANNIFTHGGVQRVVSVIANEIGKQHDIEILCLCDETKKNRDLYKLSKEIKINFNSKLLKKNLFSKAYSKITIKLNDKYGVLNNRFGYKLLLTSYYTKNARKKLIEYLNSQKYDIVIGTEGDYSILLGSIVDEINCKTIGWLHNSYNAYLKTPYKYHWNQDILFKKYASNLNKIVVLTELDKSLFQENLKIESTKIYNPLSFESDKKTLLNNKNVLCVARLEKEQKGLDLLLESFKIVNEINKEYKLIIVGDGKDKEELLNIIDDLGLVEFVKIIGFKNNIKEYYLNSDIFVSSSRWEGFGLVITEAMECGVPVIAFNNSGPTEIINKDRINGILVPKYDTIKFAEEIVELIKNDEKRKEISMAGIKRAREFNIHNITREWIELIGNIK